MNAETPSKPSKLCPTCGTRVGEEATRCLVCGTDLTSAERASRSVEAVRGSRMPEITLSLPAVLGLLAMFLVVGASLVWFALRQTNPAGAVVANEPPTATATITETQEATQSPTPTAPAPTNTLEPSPTPFNYTVQLNDQCITIAHSFGVSVQSIIMLNSLSADCSLREGQVLMIPHPTPTPTPFPTSTLSPEEATAEACPKVEYVVESGDTMSVIVAKYNVPAEAIREYNGLVNDTVYFDQKLVIPLCRRAATAGPTPTPTPPEPYKAPELLLPIDGAPFGSDEEVVSLQWAAVGELREGELYEVTVEDITEGQSRRIVAHVSDTKYIIPTSFQPRESVPHVIRWWVSTVRQVGTDDEGEPIYETAGARSLPRDFTWMGSGPVSTPAP